MTGIFEAVILGAAGVSGNVLYAMIKRMFSEFSDAEFEDYFGTVPSSYKCFKIYQFHGIGLCRPFRIGSSQAVSTEP